MARPEWFIPVHGEYRHLVHHARLAARMGVDEDKALLCEDGDSVVLDDDGVCTAATTVPAGFLYVDGTVGDVGHGVLRDRRVLAEEGVVVVVATVDPHAGEVVSAPEIITRGWIHAPEAEALLERGQLTSCGSPWRRRWPTGPPTRRRCGATPARPWAGWSGSAPGAGR